MKRLLFFVLLIFLPSLLYAQREGKTFIDSVLKKQEGRELLNTIEKKLRVTKNDTDEVALLSALSFFYGDFDPDSGTAYGMQALSLSEQSNYKRYLSNIYGSIGSNYLRKADFPKGLEYFFRSLKIEEESGHKGGIKTTSYNISSAYFNMGDYTKSLEYSNKSLKLSEETNDTGYIASNLSNIGAVYGTQGDQAKALEYLFRALALSEKIGDKLFSGVTMGHIATTYFKLKNYPLALEYDEKNLKIDEEVGDPDGISEDEMQIGYVYLTMVEDTTYKADQSNNKKYLQESIEYSKKSMVISASAGYTEILMEANEHLAAAYERSGNYEESLKAYKEYTKLKDSIYSNDSKLKLSNLATQRETQLKDKQIEINKLSENKKRNEQILFIIGIALLLIVIMAVVRSFIIQKHANAVKEESLRQKDILMKEIHHRVKNNLQVISALLDLQLTGITDEHAKNAMSESNTRIRSISLIHQQLYQNEKINAIEFSKFAKDLMYQVTSVFNKTGQKIILKSNMPETMLDIDTAVPLGLILNELMTNSYKYAFANVNEGFIEINLQQNGHYELTYKDSGPGLPIGMDIANVKGLGVKLIRSLSKQIGGAFVYVEKDRKFIIHFKDISGRKLTD